MARVLCILVVAAVLTLTTSVTQAAGPLDGAYFAVQSFPDGFAKRTGMWWCSRTAGASRLPCSARSEGDWSYAFGTIQPDGVITGVAWRNRAVSGSPPLIRLTSPSASRCPRSPSTAIT